MNATAPDTRIDLDRYATKGEARAARKLVRAILAQGWAVSVCDGEEWTVKKSRDRMTILSALASTSDDTLRVYDAEGLLRLGFAWLIWGNDPEGRELIADHSAEGPLADLIGREFPVEW